MPGKKKKTPKLPKLRVPVPPADRPHKDKRKETDRRKCREKVTPPPEETGK